MKPFIFSLALAAFLLPPGLRAESVGHTESNENTGHTENTGRAEGSEADASPAGAARPVGIYAGLGPLFQNMLKVAKGDRGERALFGEAYFPELFVGYQYRSLLPTLSYTPFGRRAGDGERRHAVLRLHVPYLLPIAGTPFEARVGGGLLVHRLYGKGGTVELRNAGSVQTYYVPTENRATRILYASVGLGLVSLDQRWRGNLDLLISGPLSRKRAFNLSLGGGYVF